MSGSTHGPWARARAVIRDSVLDRRVLSRLPGSPVSTGSGSRLGVSVGSTAHVTAASAVASMTRCRRADGSRAWAQASSRVCPVAPKRSGSGSRVSGTAQAIDIGSYCLSRW